MIVTSPGEIDQAITLDPQLFAPSRGAVTGSGTLIGMRAVVQRVTQAKVEVDGEITGEIQTGLLVLLGVTHSDTEHDAEFLAKKITELRIFPDDEGRLNRGLTEAGGALLAVSQFTLYGDCRKGRRPSFVAAAGPDQARELYNHFVEAARATGVPVETGIFQAVMQVSLVNDGPVTLVIDSPSKDSPASS